MVPSYFTRIVRLFKKLNLPKTWKMIKQPSNEKKIPLASNEKINASVSLSYRTANRFLFEKGPEFLGNMPLHFHLLFYEGEKEILSSSVKDHLSRNSQYPVSMQNLRLFAEDTFPFLERISMGIVKDIPVDIRYKELVEIAEKYNVYTDLYTADSIYHHPEITQLQEKYKEWLTLCHEENWKPESWESSEFSLIHPHCSSQNLPNWNSAVLSNGDVVVFFSTENSSLQVMGNIKSMRFSDIWYGLHYGAMRKAFTRGMHFPDDMDYNDFSNNQYEFLHSFQDEEISKLLDQKTLLDQIIQYETKIDSILQKIFRLEKSVDSPYRFAATMAKQVPPPIQRDFFPAIQVEMDHILRDWNRILFQQGIEFQGNYPRVLYISIMCGCNLRCIMCTLPQHSEEEIKELMNTQMKEETFQLIQDQLFPYAEQVLLGVGGEPTLHPKFTEFIIKAHQAGTNVYIMSNGLALSNEHIARTVVHHVKEFTISMDGATKETYERIRKRAKWDQLIRGIKQVVALRDQTPESSLTLKICYTLMTDNIDELPEIVKLAYEWGIDKIIGQHLIVTKPELASHSLSHIPEHANRMMEKALKLARQFGMEVELPSMFPPIDNSPPDPLASDQQSIVSSADIDKSPANATTEIPPQEENAIQEIPSLEESVEIEPFNENTETVDLQNHENESDTIESPINHLSEPFCRQLNFSVVINPTGLVFPCCHPEAVNELQMGRLDQQSFQDIWFGSLYQYLREGGWMPPVCKKCYIDFQYTGNVPAPQVFYSTCMSEKQTFKELYPKQFIPRNIRFLNSLLQQNSLLQNHKNYLCSVLKHMSKHHDNLVRIIRSQE